MDDFREMDDVHLPLLSSNNAPSLASNFAAWGTDYVQLSEPVLLPEAHEPRNPERPGAQMFAAAAPRESFTETSASLGLWSDRGVQYELSQQRSSLKPIASSSWYRDTHWRSPRESTHELDMPILDEQQKKCESSQTSSNTPCTPAFSRISPSETSFMELYPGDATISFLADNGEAKSITKVSIQAIEQSCPLLAAAFEHRSSGPHLHLESLSETTVLPLLRYLYTGSYAHNGESGDVYEDVPTSLLLHCQLYYLGFLYDLRALESQANVNIIRQCEFGCSSPDKPIHLSPAIKYAYEHLKSHAGILDTIISYCVSCFIRHRLAEDEEFRQIAFSLKPFHQALCRESMNRKFENETASAIIRMPFKRDTPEYYLSREDFVPPRLRDVVHHFHGEDAFDTQQSARPDTKGKGKGVDVQGAGLAIRTLSALKAFQQRSETNRTNLERLEQSNAQRRAEEAYKASRSASPPLLDERLVRLRTPVRRQSPSRPDSVFPDRRSLDDDRMHQLSGMNPDSKASENSALISDSEYEMVARPESVESLSSESEGDVDLHHQASFTRAAASLPIRERNIERSGGLSGPNGGYHDAFECSDSDWSPV